MFGDGAGDALDEVAGVAHVVIVMGCVSTLKVLFAIVGVSFSDDVGTFKVLKVAVDGCEIDAWKFRVELGGRPCSIF